MLGDYKIRLDFFNTAFLLYSIILENFKLVHVVLIPKVKVTNRVEQYRQIAFAKFYFKIIRRILADRFAPIALAIISPQQSALVKGRYILNCIITTSDCVNVLNMKAYVGNMVVKFEIKKAFDTLK